MNKLTRRDIATPVVRSIGDGEWSIEVYTNEGDFVKDFIGSNGTQSDADDLWCEWRKWYSALPVA